VPGSSNALAIAARLGFDAELLAAAQEERGDAAGQLEAALAALEAERARFTASADAAAAAEAEARRVREEHARLLSELTGKRRTAIADAKREAAALLAGAQARIEAVVRELREQQARPETIRAAHQDLRELARELEPPPEPPPPGLEPGDLRIGERVWVRTLGREGILEQHSADGRARVRLGNVSVSVQASNLLPSGAAPKPDREPLSPPSPGGYTTPETEPISARLDVRGLERESALEAVDRFLDRLLLQGVQSAEIVHGKGTGVLRQSIQDYLAKHPQVAGHRLGEHGEGGSGVTIVTLR
jgi:DNA mismatch repair protein MutS2